MKTHILSSVLLFTENLSVYEIMCQGGYRLKYNTAHVPCMPDNYGCRHTLRICNAYCCSTAESLLERTTVLLSIRTLPVLFIVFAEWGTWSLIPVPLVCMQQVL